MTLETIALQNQEISNEGGYWAPSGIWVSVGDDLERARTNSFLISPEQGELYFDMGFPQHSEDTLIEVFNETTTEGLQRAQDRFGGFPVGLNFASAKNPGGGYLRGSKAQEEDLCRCSSLYETLIPHGEYYRANRECGSMLYTDHMIFSPAVPFFRDDNYTLLERPWFAGIITAPAPNAGEFLQRLPGDHRTLENAFRRRTELVLALAADRGAQSVVLGAWGCGVFKNDPSMVADIFKKLLQNRFAKVFTYVRFSVLDRAEKSLTFETFRSCFA